MSPKNAAAVALGRRGGKARADNMSAQQRSEAARKAVEARWAKQKEELKDLVGENTEGTKALERKERAHRRKRKEAS